MATRARTVDRPRVARLSKVAVPVAVALAMLSTLAGCVLKKPPDAATIKTEAMPTVEVPANWKAPVAGPGVVSVNWLADFRDDGLTAAVAEAIAHNADLRVAAARVEQAVLYARLAGAKLYPSVDLLARGGGKMSGDGSGLEGGVLSVNWELDLWGRVRYGRAAAAADAASAQSDFEFGRQSIAALVAKSWFLATEAGLQAEIARGSLRDDEELVRLAETRSRIGVGNEEDVFVARAAAGTSRDSLRQIELRTRAGHPRPRDPAGPLSWRRGGGHTAAARASRPPFPQVCRRSSSNAARM